MIRSILTKAFAVTALAAGLVLLPSAKAEASFAAYICSTQACGGGKSEDLQKIPAVHDD